MVGRLDLLCALDVLVEEGGADQHIVGVPDAVRRLVLEAEDTEQRRRYAADDDGQDGDGDDQLDKREACIVLP